mmetsp:Transcript_9409/g.14011  ORF Transcript_9409/g.14011 Transcript_9409/m.14011 type:complete len:90 (+) Transcript_9409:172-441(+)
MAQPAPIIKIDEMEETMREFAKETALTAIQNKSTEKEIATYIKEVFERHYQTDWHCIVGRHFGAQVTFEAKHYIYMYVGQTGILLFKSA